MTITLSWEAVTAICGLMALGGTVAALYVRAVVRSEIQDAFVRLNGTYVRAKVCEAIHQQQDARITSLEARSAR